MRATGKNAQHCPATKRDGQPCTGKPLASGYCFAHDPESREWRRKGGQQRATPERVDKRLPGRLAPIVSGLEEAFAGVRKGDFDPQRAHALARLASALISSYDAMDHEKGPGFRAMDEQLDQLMLSLASNH
jgi:Family of unknown function (DUF5763)